MDGIVFHSKREMVRYSELKILNRCGAIDDLVLQPVFPLEVNGVRVCAYIADFQYSQDGQTIVEDSKGAVTALYRIKKKLFEACYPTLRIVEV
jgi:hypothetical protein